MKVLSLLQPWASLVVLGHKRIETRSWNTKYRGPLLIHASKPSAKIDRLGADFAKHYHDAGMWDIELPLGAIIGMVELADIFTSEYINQSVEEAEGWLSLVNEETQTIHGITGDPMPELAFGDYSPKRFGWVLNDPVVFKEPIPAKGTLGLWTPADDVMERVQAQIELSKQL